MMNQIHRVLLGLASLALLPLAPATAAGRGLPPEQGARVIVAFKPEANLLRMQALSATSSTDTVRAQAQRHANALSTTAGVSLRAGRFLGNRAIVMQADGLSSTELAARLSTHADVAYAVPDRRRRALLVPNDPLFAAGPSNGQGPAAGQWYLRTPDETLRSASAFQGAWDLATGKSTMVVAVLDTGVLSTHPDLSGAVLQGYDMIDDLDTANDGNGRDGNASDPGDWITAAEDTRRGGPFEGCGEADSSWHGTQVSGIIAALANNGQGMAGAAHGVRILPVRVLGKCGGYDSDIIAGIYWAAGVSQPGMAGSSTPARVLNLSLGGAGSCTQPYAEAVAAVGAAPYHAVVVAAAGNSTGHAVGSPANCAGVIGVAGLRHTGSKVGFSDLGPEVALAAPAGNCVNIDAGSPCLYPILTTSNSGTRGPTATGSIYTDSFNITVGTSFATPIVAAAAALVLTVRPEYTPAQVISTLKRSTRPFPTTGSDNGTDPTPVELCRTPDGTDQLQCYCTSGLCGAGMLDAAAAVMDAQQKVALAEGARQLLNFGEAQFPQFFPGRPETAEWGPFLFRFYPGTGTYLGVVVHSDATYRLNGVYVMGGPFGAAPQYVGQVTDYLTPTVATGSTAATSAAGRVR